LEDYYTFEILEDGLNLEITAMKDLAKTGEFYNEEIIEESQNAKSNLYAQIDKILELQSK
tara:strand:+ start:288 stop:467 length:180 start_codon:yes stop_codon:yes gene_type:complete